jgi:2-polyprenyl-6-methoxyphenol hydroxylase-like FAD-dependent oxidoreductase
MSETQVIIIGAGPTGLMLACQLQRCNISFIILDKNQQTTHLSKAMVVHARTLEIFNELGIADKAVQIGEPARRFNMVVRGKVRGTLEIGNFGEGLSQFPFALILEQNKTEKLLSEHLIENGAQIEWGCELEHVNDLGSGVRVTYKDKQGNNQAVSGRYLVGCDGASSLVRHQLGLAFEGDTQERTFYVADVRLDSPITKGKEAYFVMIRNGFALFFAMEGDRHYRIIGTIPENETHKVQQFSDIKETIREQVAMPMQFLEEYWFSTYKVHSRMALDFKKGNCFLAGDAAHIHTPAGGQGMNTGLQDAYNLGWKLAYVISGKAESALLESYDQERVSNAKNLLHSTDRLFDVLAGTGILSNAFRLYLLPGILKLVTKSHWLNKRIFPTLSMIGIHYPDSPLTIKGRVGKISSGDRMPHFTINGQSIYERIKAPAFKILHFGNGSHNLSQMESKIQPQILEFKETPELFATESEFYIVLRPDNYIAYIGKNLEKIKQALNL